MYLIQAVAQLVERRFWEPEDREFEPPQPDSGVFMLGFCLSRQISVEVRKTRQLIDELSRTEEEVRAPWTSKSSLVQLLWKRFRKLSDHLARAGSLVPFGDDTEPPPKTFQLIEPKARSPPVRVICYF